MARQKSKERAEAYRLYKESKGKKKLKDIATELGVSAGLVRKWKSQDGWSSATKKKGNVTKAKSNVTKRVKAVEKSCVLTEKEKLFVKYYIIYNNATKAAKLAGYATKAAHQTGYQLLRKSEIIKEIQKAKKAISNDLTITAKDVLQKYIDIAFSDISNFLEWGSKETFIRNNGELVLDEDGNPKTEGTYNYVKLQDSAFVDTSLVTEIKQNELDVTIKLADKMKALEKLEKWFDLGKDREFARKIKSKELELRERELGLREKSAGMGLDDEDNETGVIELPQRNIPSPPPAPERQ